MAARHPERINNLVVWGANAFVTQQDAKLYEKVRNIDNWSEPMRKPFLEVYDENYFHTQFSLWVDAICTYLKKFNGNNMFLLDSPSIYVFSNEISHAQNIV